MAYLTTINLVQGDQLPEIEITLKDSNTAVAGAKKSIIGEYPPASVFL